MNSIFAPKNNDLKNSTGKQTRMTHYLFTSLQALEEQCRTQLSVFFGKDSKPPGPVPYPDDQDLSPLANLTRRFKLSGDELIILMTALAPHLVPGFFDRMIREFLPDGGEFPEFGGVRDQNHRGFIPTGETAMFILGGMDLEKRMSVFSLFDEQQPLFNHKILALEEVKQGVPLLSGRLTVEPEFAEVFTTGKVSLPRFGIRFPAQHITTQMEWSDLVLNNHTLRQVRELENWLQHNDTLMYEWKLGKKVKPGYRVLFYGPPGTGKTLTATLLGKQTGRHVFRIDLSMIVSKYIGETEKNLASLFDKAEHKDWILFFDEADALFGKRTGVRDAHDKYANQEVSYLLQRVEMHAGLVILASNFRGNIDEAFIRRFNSVVYFPPPDEKERLALWRKAFPETITLAEDVDLKKIAADYKLTGSHIINIVQYLCLDLLERESLILNEKNLRRGIRRELEKEGK